MRLYKFRFDSLARADCALQEQQAESGPEDDEGDGPQQDLHDQDLHRLEMFCRRDSQATDFARMDREASDYIEELAGLSEEAVAAGHEQKIYNEAKKALQKTDHASTDVNVQIDVFGNAAEMNAHTLEEAVEEAVLNHLCGNEQNIQLQANAASTGSANAVSAATSSNHYLLRWVQEMTASAEAFKFLAKDQPNKSDGSLGLVTVKGSDGPRVCLFQWVLPLKSGRIADLDENSCVKMIVPVGAKKNPISPQETILTSTGVSLEKVKKKERPSIPGSLLRLIKIWEAALALQSEENESSVFGDGCSYCEQVGELRLHMCCCCLQTYHEECVDAVVNALSVLEAEAKAESHGASPMATELTTALNSVKLPRLLWGGKRLG